MYKPYVSDSESGSEDDMITKWHNVTRAQLPVPTRDLLPGVGSDVPDEPYESDRVHFTERRQTTVVMVNSLDRDQQVYPLPTQVRLKLPREYKNVERIDIVQVKFFCGLYWVTKANNTLTVDVSGTPYTAAIDPGSYGLAALCSSVQAALTLATSRPFLVTYSSVTGRITIAASVPFSIVFPTSSAYSEWGLGWNLGWGGQPVNQTGQTSYTADNFPRLGDDYIFLQLNDTEHMNGIDHTDLEATGRVQDSTGQVSHYFGKLLLNNFGCWAQTFIEAPKNFVPVLSRLDRLNFTWTDRHGTTFTTDDAASCEWHMTLRITEVQQIQTIPKTPA